MIGKAQTKQNCSFLSILSELREIFADFMFREQWTGALQVQPHFWNNDFILRMFCSADLQL